MMDEDVTHRLKTESWKCSTTTVLCDRRILTEVEGKSYRLVIGPAILDGLVVGNVGHLKSNISIR